MAIDLTEDADERMEAELVTKMGELERGQLQLTEEMDKKLRAIAAQIYFDDYQEGDTVVKLLDGFRRRDMGGGGIIANIGHPNDPLPRRKNKRPISQVLEQRGPEKLTVSEALSGGVDFWDNVTQFLRPRALDPRQR